MTRPASGNDAVDEGELKRYAWWSRRPMNADEQRLAAEGKNDQIPWRHWSKDGPNGKATLSLNMELRFGRSPIYPIRTVPPEKPKDASPFAATLESGLGGSALIK